MNKKLQGGVYPDLDILKFALSCLILARHLAQVYATAGTFTYVLVVNIFSTVGVPTFFVVSGFLLAQNHVNEKRQTFSQIKRVLRLYLVWTVIYLPLSIREILRSDSIMGGIFNYLQNTVFSGSHYHLWFLPALAVGFAVTLALKKVIHSKKGILIITLVLFLIGLFGDSWDCLLPEKIRACYGVYNKVFLTTRNGIFFAPVFIFLGEMIAQNLKSKPNKIVGVRTISMILFAGCFLLIGEGCLLYATQPEQVNNMMFSTLVLSPVLVLLCIRRLKEKGCLRIRRSSTIVFCIHPWVIAVANNLLTTVPISLKVIFIVVITIGLAFVISMLSESCKLLKFLS